MPTEFEIPAGQTFRRDGLTVKVIEATTVQVEEVEADDTPKNYYRKLSCQRCGFGPLRGTAKVVGKHGPPLCPACAPGVVGECRCGRAALFAAGVKLPTCQACAAPYVEQVGHPGFHLFVEAAKEKGE